MDWREGTSVSLDELDTVLAGDGEDEDEMMLRYLNSDLSHRSPGIAHGRTRALGRSPQRGVGASASSPKRGHIEAFNSLLTCSSPVKRASPARGGGASTPHARKLLSTNGVFAAGSEACFRGTRTSIIPLVSPSTCFMPGSARALAAASRETDAALLAAVESSDLLAFFPTPTASPMPQRTACTLGGGAAGGAAALSARASTLRRATAADDGGAHSQPQTPSDRDRPPRRSPYREQQLAAAAPKVAAASAGWPHVGAGSPAHASSLLSPATRRPAPPFVPPAAQPASRPGCAATWSASPAHEQPRSPAAERGAAAGARAQRMCTPSMGTQPQLDADGTMVTPGALGARGTPTGAGEGSVRASQLFGRRINFAPMTPAGQRTAAGTALKRVAVFGATQTPTAAKAAASGGGGGGGGWASPGSAGALASLSKINSMLNHNALTRTDARSPARGAGAAAAASPAAADARALAFLAHEELLLDDGGADGRGFGGPLPVDGLVDAALIPHLPADAALVGRHEPLLPVELSADLPVLAPSLSVPSCPILVVRTRSVSMHQAVQGGRPAGAAEPPSARADGRRELHAAVGIAPTLRRERSSTNDVSIASTAVLTPRLADHAERAPSPTAHAADASAPDGAGAPCAWTALAAARADSSGGFTYKFGAVRREAASHALKEAPPAAAASARALRRDTPAPAPAQPTGSAAGCQQAPAGINARINFTVVENGRWTRTARSGRQAE